MQTEDCRKRRNGKKEKAKRRRFLRIWWMGN
jgi:hypothetical protein